MRTAEIKRRISPALCCAAAVAMIAGCSVETSIEAAIAERGVWPTPEYRGRQMWPMFSDAVHLKTSDGAYAIPPSARGLENLTMAKSYASVIMSTNHPGIPEFRRGYSKRYYGDIVKDPASGKPYWAVRIPAERRHQGKYTLRDLVGPDFADFLYSTNRPSGRLWCAQTDSPLMLNFPESRPVYFLPDRLEPDREDFLKWKSAHPNFIGFYAMGEIDSDTYNYVQCVGGNGNNLAASPEPDIKAAMSARFPPPANRWEWFENLKRVWAKQVEFHFGENMFWPLYCNVCSLAHMNAALGAVGLINETSSSCGAPFAFSGMYTRGASRQWGIPFIWYAACFYDGFFRDGRENRKMGQWTNRWPRDGVLADGFPAYMGSSRSLMHRQQSYGWLIGAAAVQDENLSMHSASAANGVPCPSPYAADMNRLIERSLNVDRGASFTPVAFLVPLTESFHRLGRLADSGNGCQANLPAWFCTLVPFNDTDEPDGSLRGRRRRGDEGCLFNSPFGDFVDVLVPDAGQPSDRFSAVLDHYAMAIMMGSYRKGDVDVAALESFVRKGGVLVLSSDYVEEGIVPGSLAGVAFDGRVASGQELRNAAGTPVERLNGAYSLATAARLDKGVKVVLSDECGTPVAFSRPLGAGRVVTLAPKRGMPAAYVDLDGSPDSAREVEKSIRGGRGELGLIRYLLAYAQKRFVPVMVEGDAFWGLSRTANGWFLWLMNNKGVVKYAGEPAEFDVSKTAKVKVSLRSLAGFVPRDAETGERLAVGHDGSFAVTVGPGEMRFVSFDRNKNKEKGKTK